MTKGMIAAAAVCALLGRCAIQAHAQSDVLILGTAGQVKQVTFDRMLDDMSKADAVFVGEQHDHARGHQLELDILKGLQARNPKTLLSLEMFERDVQPVVDEYVGGNITESHFLQSSRPWPTYKTDYRPLVELAKEKGLPIIAANAPRRYVNIVSRKGQAGLNDLPKASRNYLGRFPYSMELPAGYDKMLTDLFGDAHGQTAGSPAPTNPASPPNGMPSTANMKEAQALWDVTMADSIARALREHKGWKVMQVNGAGHSDSRYGIVDRLRQMNPRLKFMVVSIRPDSDYPNVPGSKYAGIADYMLVTGPDAKKAP